MFPSPVGGPCGDLGPPGGSDGGLCSMATVTWGQWQQECVAIKRPLNDSYFGIEPHCMYNCPKVPFQAKAKFSEGTYF